jgi:hypothetical protein
MLYSNVNDTTVATTDDLLFTDKENVWGSVKDCYYITNTVKESLWEPVKDKYYIMNAVRQFLKPYLDNDIINYCLLPYLGSKYIKRKRKM